MSRTTLRVGRRAIVVAAAVSLAVATGSFAASAPAASRPSNRPLKSTIPPGTVINFGDQQQSFETLLNSSGALDGAPYKVNFVEFASGPLVDSGFAANQLDIGEMGDLPAALAENEGLKVKALAVSLATGASEFLVAKPGITSVKQLKGLTVAYTTGTAEQAFALRMLASAGLTQGQVTQVNVSLEQLGTAIESGAADASVLSVEQLVDYQEQTPGAVVLGSSTTAKPPSYSYILGTQTALANPAKKAAIEDLLKRLLRANDWRNAHLADWIQDYYVSVENQTVATAKLIEKDGGLTEFKPITPEVNAALETVVKLMVSAQALPTAFATANLFQASWTKEYNSILAGVPQHA
jgi:sulfonate transport system substrate-binding protein